MSIQWFPGHMTKAKRQIQEKLKLIDIVIELLDARIPESSRNPMIDEIMQNKPRLAVLNKSDMADPNVTADWIRSFQQQGLEAIAVDSQSGKQVKEIPSRIQKMLQPKFEALKKKGIQNKSIRILIAGIPNVGKSTLINRLSGRHAAATGDRPGVTKGQQWIKVGQSMELLDTPGILWPKFDDPAVGYKLAATGAVKETIFDPQDVVFFTIKHLIPRYSDRLEERYGLDLKDQSLDVESIVQLMEEIGRKRGCLLPGGKIDLEKTSKVILRDLQTMKLGPISLDYPE